MADNLRMQIDRVFLIAKALLILATFAPAQGRVQVSKKHPQYWEYRGEPVLLLGGSIEDNLFQKIKIPAASCGVFRRGEVVRSPQAAGNQTLRD